MSITVRSTRIRHDRCAELTTAMTAMTMFPANLFADATLDILLKAMKTRILSSHDYCELTMAVFDDSLDNEYKNSINRLLRAVRRGSVRVVDPSDLLR